MTKALGVRGVGGMQWSHSKTLSNLPVLKKTHICLQAKLTFALELVSAVWVGNNEI